MYFTMEPRPRNPKTLQPGVMECWSIGVMRSDGSRNRKTLDTSRRLVSCSPRTATKHNSSTPLLQHSAIPFPG